MKLYTHIFLVTGRGAFPLDMVRYDTCHPQTGDDVDTMIDDTNSTELRTVKLVAAGKRKNWQPTYERWASFGWTAERQHQTMEIT